LYNCGFSTSVEVLETQVVQFQNLMLCLILVPVPRTPDQCYIMFVYILRVHSVILLCSVCSYILSSVSKFLKALMLLMYSGTA
jgi:hypothetical protein